MSGSLQREGTMWELSLQEGLLLRARRQLEHRALQAMVKVTVGKAEDPWCEIELTEEDVED